MWGEDEFDRITGEELIIHFLEVGGHATRNGSAD